MARTWLIAILALLLGCDGKPIESKTTAVDSSAKVNEYDAGVAAYRRGDFPEAARRFRKAIDGEWTITTIFAAGNLGEQYLSGKGVRQDYTEAEKWLRKAAESGTGVPQLNLGIMYRDGLGLPKDNVQAHKWLNLAAAYLSNQEHGKDAVLLRDAVARQMTTAQMGEAQKLAREWKRKCWDGSVAPDGELC